MRFLLSLTLLSALAPFANADVKLPAILSDGMVLQRGKPILIWGWAEPGEKVAVAFGPHKKETEADKEGRWRVTLDPTDKVDAKTLTVQGKNAIEIKDVLLGEVWLGSGQSNMAMTVNRCKDFEAEAKAAEYPEIRFFKETSNGSRKPESMGKGKWEKCSPATVAGASATLYFFGREIHKEMKTPVGLINSSVGGTPIESWIASDVQLASPKLKPEIEKRVEADAKFDLKAAKEKDDKALAAWKAASAKSKADGKPSPKQPTSTVKTFESRVGVGGLYNGKIAPLVGYSLRGMLWYQGEANTNGPNAVLYEEQLSQLVTSWRKAWNNDAMPFAWVQLPNFGGGTRDFPTVREGMRQAALKLPNTGMAVAIDVGETNDIHPKNKQEVGRRLSLWALATVYGKQLEHSGPVPHKLFVDADGALHVEFKHADGLKGRDGDPVGFEIAGKDGKYQPAKATIKGAEVILSNPEIKQPVKVRYGWANDPKCNLVNGAGLPSGPFRME